MKKILGLDLGTNSVGWALIDKDQEKILGLGSRIIPMGDDKGNFEAGKKITRNATRRIARGIRRGNHRYKLRRNKLLFALHKLCMLSDLISVGYFEKDASGNDIKVKNQFPAPEKLQKLFVEPIRKGNKKYKGDTALSILELRAKALNEMVSLKELGRILYLLNQRRGYSGGGEEDEKEITNQEGETQKVKKVYKELKPLKITPSPHFEEIKVGKTKKLFPVYKLKVVNVQTGEAFEGFSIKGFAPNTETNVTLTKPAPDNKNTRFYFEDDEIKYSYEGSDIIIETFNCNVLECTPVHEFKKKKWVYEIEIFDADENEDEKIGDGKLLLKHTKNLEKILLNEPIEFELNITTKANGTKEFEFLLPNKTSWKKNLESRDKNITDRRKLKFEANELDACGNGNYHVCHSFLDDIKKDNKVNTDFKIRDNVILRKRYIEEFNAIWERQIQINPEFKKLTEDKYLLEEIISYIFPERDPSKPETEQSKNSQKQELKKIARENGLKEVIEKQIIYYQRKLKSQKDLIGGCQYETSVDENNKPVYRVIERSHPLFQEFRMWDQINKCYVDARNPESERYKYKKRFLTKEEKQAVYDKLNKSRELTYEGWCSCLNLRYEGKGKDKRNIDWPRGLHKKEKFKGNETLKSIKTLLGEDLFEKAFGDSSNFIHYTDKKYIDFYSTMFDSAGSNEMDISDKRVQDIRQFISEHITEKDIPDNQNYNDFLNKRALEMAKFKFPRKYASLSAKAIQKLLPLMQVDSKILQEVGEHKRKFELLTSVYNEFKHRLRQYDAQQEMNNEKISKALLADFYREYDIQNEPIDKGGWPYWAAAGLMYGRHTAEQKERITDYHQIQPLGKEETLRNPVVEQMVNETLQTIKSILKKYQLKPNDLEIRVELARELKNNAKERESMHKSMLNNASANKFAAYEIMQMEYEDGKKKIKPENQCKEDGCNSSCYKSARLKQPTANEILKYRLWKEQGMVSPYTGNPIPLCKLFDGSQYNKEHIIPKQRFFDDSQSNLVMAETAVNKIKDNLTAIEFIRKYGGKEVAGFAIKSLNKYESDVMYHPTLGNGKKKKLLMKEIPEDFIERQKKETQYIARKVKEKLGSIVGLENVTTTTGSITDHLREMWKLNNAFKKMNKERFELMATMVQEPKESWCYEKEVESKKGGKKKVLVLKNWNKRLDHRHHAIDALVIACTTQAQVTQLNTLNQKVQEKLKAMYEDLRSREDITEEEIANRMAEMSEKEKEIFQEELGALRQFEFPWEKEQFLPEAKEKIEQLLVSFKGKKRLLIQNKEDKNGKRTNELMLKVRGALHLAKSYGTRNIERTANATLEEAYSNPNFICNEIIKNEVKARKSIYTTFKEFKTKLKQEPIKYFEGENEKTISDGKVKIEIYIGKGDVNTKTITWDDFANADNPEKLIEKIVFKPLKKDIEDHFLIHNNGKKDDAFSDIGIDEFNKRRSEIGLKPISKILIYFSKNSDEIALKPIIHKNSFKNNKEGGETYYETKDNYCYAILQKNDGRDFLPISFFDAASWVTNQFRTDLKSGYKFPKRFEERLDYIEKIIRKKIKEEKPDFEILYLLQQDDLVYLPFDKEDAKKAEVNPGNDFWFDKEKKRWKRVYRVVKFSGSRCYFIPFTYSTPIVYKPLMDEEEKKQREKDNAEIPKEGIFEFGSYKNCSPFSLPEMVNGQSLTIKIQDFCIKIEIDRLGNISSAH